MPEVNLFAEKLKIYKQQIKKISEDILNQMIQSNGKWEMPWHKGIPIAKNVVTGRQYGGNNLLILWSQCLQNNYKNNQWATFKQWRKRSAKVRKGQKGTLICIAIPKKEAKNGNNQLRLFDPIYPGDIREDNLNFRFKFLNVFNVDQVDGYFGNQPGLFDDLTSGEELLSQLVSKSKAVIKIGGERACYSSYYDLITMPEMARFHDTSTSKKMENYYSTLVHELIHWTGHKTRCKRQLMNKFGSPEYAFEELVAELGSALLCTQLNQKTIPRPDHAYYLKSWLSVLKNDFSYFAEAIELARTAVFYLNDLTGIYPALVQQNLKEVNEKKLEKWKLLANDVAVDVSPVQTNNKRSSSKQLVGV
jgi:antirestriction protein ArdC